VKQKELIFFTTQTYRVIQEERSVFWGWKYL